MYDAIQLMADKEVGTLLVMSGAELKGMLSERDYTRKVVLHGKNSKETRGYEIVSRSLVVLHPQPSAQAAMQITTHHRVRHLPVVEHDIVVGVFRLGTWWIGRSANKKRR